MKKKANPQKRGFKSKNTNQPCRRRLLSNSTVSWHKLTGANNAKHYIIFWLGVKHPKPWSSGSFSWGFQVVTCLESNSILEFRRKFVMPINAIIRDNLLNGNNDSSPWSTVYHDDVGGAIRKQKTWHVFCFKEILA